MKISGDEAIAILRKWENESTEIKGTLEFARQFSVGLTKFRGKVALSGSVLSISGGGFEVLVDISDADFEYQDWREAPDQVKEWAQANFESLLIILSSNSWYCGIFEIKPRPS